MVRRFIAGDRVQPKNGCLTMEVVKYIIEHELGVGKVYSDHHVRCVWYELGKRKIGVFHQRTLFKVNDSLI